MQIPLFTLLVEDGNGVGQPVAFGLMTTEDQAHIEGFLNFFKKHNDTSTTKCIVVDKDLAEINAIKSVLGHVHVIICYFHVLRAIDRHLTSVMHLSSDKLTTCLEVSKVYYCIVVHIDLAEINANTSFLLPVHGIICYFLQKHYNCVHPKLVKSAYGISLAPAI